MLVPWEAICDEKNSLFLFSVLFSLDVSESVVNLAFLSQVPEFKGKWPGIIHGVYEYGTDFMHMKNEKYRFSILIRHKVSAA